MQGDISLMQIMDTACVNIENAINTKIELSKDFSDNASLLRVMPHYQPNKSGYDLLVSKGISIISNDSLRNSISTHYENLYTYYNRYEEERFMFHINISEPKLLEYFSFEFDLDNTYYWQANISLEDYEKLLDDESFKKILKAIESENKQVLSRAIRVANSIEKQLNFLDNEIQAIE
jgi:transcription termination factor NusB